MIDEHENPPRARVVRTGQDVARFAASRFARCRSENSTIRPRHAGASVHRPIDGMMPGHAGVVRAAARRGPVRSAPACPRVPSATPIPIASGRVCVSALSGTFPVFFRTPRGGRSPAARGTTPAVRREARRGATCGGCAAGGGRGGGARRARAVGRYVLRAAAAGPRPGARAAVNNVRPRGRGGKTAYR